MKHLSLLLVSFTCYFAMFSSAGHAAVARERSTYLLPMNCGELLPDASPFLGFLEAVGKGIVSSDRASSKRIFRILALREKLTGASVNDHNPADIMIQKTLCFYREQKEPIKQVPYDDSGLVSFIRGSLKELEQKVEQAVFEVEYERAQRMQFEQEIEKNQHIVEKIEQEALTDAEKAYKRLAESARRKVSQ